MAILHEVPYEALKEVVPAKIADLIMKAREGKVNLSSWRRWKIRENSKNYEINCNPGEP